MWSVSPFWVTEGRANPFVPEGAMEGPFDAGNAKAAALEVSWKGTREGDPWLPFHPAKRRKVSPRMTPTLRRTRARGEPRRNGEGDPGGADEKGENAPSARDDRVDMGKKERLRVNTFCGPIFSFHGPPKRPGALARPRPLSNVADKLLKIRQGFAGPSETGWTVDREASVAGRFDELVATNPNRPRPTIRIGRP
jgi:hypothetical protein